MRAGSHAAWCLLALGLERRLLLPALRPLFAVAWGPEGLLGAVAIVCAGAALRFHRLGGEELSAMLLQLCSGAAALVLSVIVGVPILARPMCAAAALALTEFWLSKELVWYLIVSASVGAAVW